MRVAAIVVTHLGGSLLQDCIDSIRAQTRPVDELLVVVSNKELAVDAPSIQLGHNAGFAVAANAGARATRGEVLLLNDDTRLEARCVEHLAAAWRGIAVYQPRIRLADGSGRLDNIGLGFLPDGSVWARGRNGPDQPIKGVPGCFSGAAALVAREAWDGLGGFDERLGNFGEDVDLSLRLHRRGVPIHSVPDAVVLHHLGASWGRASAEKVRLIERNRVRAAVRSLPMSALLCLPATTLLRYVVLAGLAGRGHGPGAELPAGARLAAVRGFAEGLADAPHWLADRRRDQASWSSGEWAMLTRMWQGRARWEDVSR
ncbi:MAG: glycosyltransferase family 2 protein [Myxococcales bacterium]|nr:glycosyltransferase family 2 protein [Myxococcales bacterium]